jgi:flavin-dependent dehydrogenase
MTHEYDIAIIGAGPAGAVASAMLAQKGWKVRVFEREHFPRFSIGESLLPQSMHFLEEAGLLEAVQGAKFQFKDGAAFARGSEYTDIYFPDKSTEGWGTTFQVRRDRFDQLLIEGAAKKGVEVSFGDTVTAFESDESGARLTVKTEAGETIDVRARFALDGSGFGRVLPRLLNLDRPSTFGKRRSVFRHVIDNIDDPTFDRNKILISINPNNPQIWYWLIPLADGMSSIGAVGPDEDVAAYGETPEERLLALLPEAERMSAVLRNAEPARAVGEIVGFSCAVESLYGPSFALLGNAAEFLDPVFSSGVTIAFKSASLATKLVDRQLRGETVDWHKEYAEPLCVGVETFRACVSAWYDGSLQRIIFDRPRENTHVSAQLTAVLAGYAWDQSNPLVRRPQRYLRLVDEACRVYR